MVWTLVVDYGKPYEEKFYSLSPLKLALLKLKDMADSGEYAYMDVHIYDSKDKDVTDELFKKLKIMG